MVGMRINQDLTQVKSPAGKRGKRWSLIRAVSFGLVLGMLNLPALWSPAQAFPFFHRHPHVQQNLPPSAQGRPGLIQPPPLQPVVPTPAAPVEPIQVLVKRGVFPPDALTRSTPITRAEWATILVKAIGHNTGLVSEFPFYRDVPANYPAYVPIEVAREKKLITYQNDHGFYYPAQPVTYQEAYVSIAQAIAGPPPTPEAVTHLLQGFPDWSQLSAKDAAAVAKMVRVHFFRKPKPQTLLHPKEDVTFTGAAPLVTDLIHLIQLRTPLQAEKETEIDTVPAGLNLTLTPMTSILEASLSVGQSVSFTLVNPIGPLPKESRFTGQVISATPSARTYTVELTQVKTPEGDEYKTKAQFTIAFSPRSRITFLVPGELYSAITQLPATASTTGEKNENPTETGTPQKQEVPFSQPSPVSPSTKPQKVPEHKPSQLKP